MEKKLGEVFEQISEENAKLNTVAEENLAGVRTVKAFAREKYEIKKFLSHNKRYYELNMQQSKVFVRYYPYFQLITKLLPIVILLLGGRMVMLDVITLGTLGAFIEYSNNIVWPMEMLGWLSNDISAGIASNKKITKIFSEIPVITENMAEVSKTKTLARLFSYLLHYKLQIFGVLLIMAYCVGVNLVNPLLMERAIDKHIALRDFDGLYIEEEELQ